MGGAPLGLRWEAIYPLMERLQLAPAEWDELHHDLQVMEPEAIATIAEFMPKPKSKK